jgi:lipoate---protein ligase
MSRPQLTLLQFNNLPISKQLALEEQLLKGTQNNYCIINNGSSEKAIVMGLSAHPPDVIDQDRVSKDEIKVIKRFTGGGTVIVDEGTVFVTFIFNNDAHPFDPYPHDIHHWTGEFYRTALPFKDFFHRDNDYVLGDKKVGGSAQYIQKNRWLHHSSFLYTFEPKHMSYLTHPPREPAYRQGRPHLDFIAPLSPRIPRLAFISYIENELRNRFLLQHELYTSLTT